MTISIKTADTVKIKEIFKNARLPKKESHKGQNGRVLIIGGSALFHAASIWAAEVASHFTDIVHYSSTVENNEIFTSLKKQFTNGIVVSRDHLESYIKEDDAILVGPGMLRKITNHKSQITNKFRISNFEFQNLKEISDEAEYTYCLTKFLIENYPDKKYVFDAGSLQMMDPKWLLLLKKHPVITPHQIEFEQLFNIKIHEASIEEKAGIVTTTAKNYNITILLKAVDDIISDGKETYIIKGGNQGLTKGGTGDTLAGLAVSFLSKESSIKSALYASILLKQTADELLQEKGYWYNISDIIQHIPITMQGIMKMTFS